MARFLLGVIAAILAIAICGYTYVAMGFAPVATTATPLPFETAIAHMAMHRTVARQMPITPTIAASEDTFAAGAHLYRTHCAVCHGLPGQPKSAIATGEFPKPPELFKGTGVTDDSPGETWWKVANGIRLTGMPGFKGSLSDEQMWQISLLVANADKLSQSVKDILQPPLPNQL